MKITATRGASRVEINKRRATYEAEEAAYKAAEAEISRKSYVARAELTEPVEAELREGLAAFTALRFDVEARFSSAFTADYGAERSYIKVRIVCNDRQSDDDALQWEYQADLDYDGNVIVKTGSWSGLQATTPAQMKSLRQTVMAIEYLNDLDWRSLIDKDSPGRRIYQENPLPEKPKWQDWRSEYRVADLADIVGDMSTAILVRNWENSGFYGNKIWVRILRDSGSQYTVNVIPESYKQYAVEGKDIPGWVWTDTKRVRKNNLYPIYDNEDNPTYWDIPEEFANS